jgi:hypothetical protein
VIFKATQNRGTGEARRWDDRNDVGVRLGALSEGNLACLPMMEICKTRREEYLSPLTSR